MKPSHPESSASERGLGQLVEDVERLLHEPLPSGPDGDPRLAPAMEALEEAVARAPAPSRRLARRVERVRALYALRSRQVPPKALDGLYESVRARTTEAERGDLVWRRAGMSNTFLDAPRSLARWRHVAVAACALIAVGVGLVATRQVEVVDPAARSSGSSPTNQAAEDPRDDLLPRWKPASAEPAAWQPWVRKAGMSSRRASSPRRPFTFTVRPRRNWDAGLLLDVVPAGGSASGDDLEKN